MTLDNFMGVRGNKSLSSLNKNSIIKGTVVMGMKIDLTKLIYGPLNQLPIDTEITIPMDLLKDTDIREITKVRVIGDISSNNEEYNLNVVISGTMILPCARTLKDVTYPFSIEIDEIIGEGENYSLDIVQNRVDIFPIIWQYILADVPLRVLHPDASDEPVSGDGWRLVNEDDRGEVINPRLAKLKEYQEE
ncbi:MAG: DUF177 domain-containing protein [Bacilli bacterium]|nr:DUF177 domain-containing protein [Bacilli bacterium]